MGQLYKSKNGINFILSSYNPDPIPVVGKTYYTYDDGKISLSREGQVKVLRIIPAWRMPLRLRFLWMREKREFDWVFEPKTDFVIVTEVCDCDEPRKEYFFRQRTGEWFSIETNRFGGSFLDVKEYWHYELTREREK